ncbi:MULTISPECIES: DNA cytosine methyltransferase [unclassified Chelatococcus]|uniref:DNA cytosine methyltransferase n=1 Tax=unclassified Chelatococcus TaxID=2638111 RepID=UPI001BD040D9|nr:MULTISPECIES: DNA cytosine methyltransferase [unclassified Chelatococcus]CAH1670633.1 DNA (cytosine-5-)-methyltransferase [Hyphomicrobiales bacterium]MBS7738360.1 DNA cytosine methyltransferase [Chelatococcus sp. HY11]MBX3545888.1 DNA cytosine methyltransferase [Chelatococcus sp.]MCO5077294.1 DNA cytosine methyltransferase [Chelatococcus sp.]CAH1677133.1 DNA (cytosine-5-)-methyltransferase [Hyphomicrobiales bacterium]
MTFHFGSVCSGIEAASVAWHPLGWRAAFVSEIEKFPRAVLAHHYPDVPLHGDFTTIQAGDYEPIDLLVGGTPCQSFSIAGLRGGLGDDRGNLALEFLRLADRLRPRWLVWENVPGVLSSLSHAAPDPCPPPPPLDMGCSGAELDTEDEYHSEELHAFYCFLAGLSDLGYGFAYRMLDAQYFGVPQRRRRVFVVGYLGDWRPAAAVLFERESLRGDLAPRREAGERATVGALAGTSPSGGWRIGADEAAAGQLVAFGGNNTAGPIDVATAINAHGGPYGRMDFESETFVAHAFDARQSDVVQYGDMTGPLDTDGWGVGVQDASAVRRLTPRECERLQGFEDDWTLIPFRGKPAADGPRYKALGNSMAVPVMRWIGERIAMTDMNLKEAA